MKKFLLPLVGIALMSGSANAAVAPYDGEAQLVAARADLENWQKYLPDNMFAAHVSMPGSHDSATGHNVSFASSSKAQSVLLEDQLKGGIRAFDFRPGFSKSTVDGQTVVTIKCNHGIASTDLTFDDAFTILTNYLKAHPQEFFAIHLFRGSPSSDPSAADQAVYNQAVDELFNTGKFADYFVDFDPYLTVGEMRGKIVVFRRDRLSWCKINKAGNLGNWPGDKDLWEKGAAANATNAMNPTLSGRVRVTDVSSPKNENELNTKKQSITNLFKANCEQETPNEAKAKGAYKPEWSMIFTSGEYTSGQKGYLTCATHTNPLLAGLINDAVKSGPTGIVFSDWVLLDKFEYSGTEYEVKGNDVVKAVLENNFKYAADYILDDELFNDSKDISDATDYFGNNTYFMRNAASGKFLAAGADWGTHAVLGDNGIRIATFFDKREGTYLLRTTFRQNGMDNYLGDNAYIDNTAPCAFTASKSEGSDTYVFTRVVDGKTMALGAVTNGNTYADGTKQLVDYTEYAKGDKNQEWEFISEADLVNELAETATAEQPADLTFKIHGYKLDPNDDAENNMWIFKNELKKNSTTYCVKTQVWGSNDWNDKDMVYRVYADRFSNSYPENFSWELSQEVTGLPEGLYTVTAQAFIDNFATEEEGKKVFEMEANGIDMAQGIHTESTGSFTCDKGSGIDVLRDTAKSLRKAENVEVGADGKLLLRMAKTSLTATAKFNFFFDNFSLRYHGPKSSSGIENVAIDSTIAADTLVDVYNVAGVTVVRGVRYADAFSSLAHGVYIVTDGTVTRKVVK